jgi:hypothetical protein
MPELMLRASFFPDGQLPDSSRAWLRSLLPAKDIFRCSNGWGKALSTASKRQATDSGTRETLKDV